MGIPKYKKRKGLDNWWIVALSGLDQMITLRNNLESMVSRFKSIESIINTVETIHEQSKKIQSKQQLDLLLKSLDCSSDYDDDDGDDVGAGDPDADSPNNKNVNDDLMSVEEIAKALVDMDDPFLKREFKELKKDYAEIKFKYAISLEYFEIKVLQYSIESMICVHKSSFLMPEEKTEADEDKSNLLEKLDDMESFLLMVAELIEESAGLHSASLFPPDSFYL
ncbi:MAG: hypothetical protein ACTSWN_00175 [Promethearchaeota archaeon]